MAVEVYRIDYPYYSWAETVVRPRIKRRDFSRVIEELNQLEPQGGGRWKYDSGEMTSAIKFIGMDGKLGTSRLQPDRVAATFSKELASTVSGVARA